MSRVGAIVRSYKLTDYLPAVLEQYKWVDRLLVLNYLFPDVERCEDDTEKIAKEFGCEFKKGEGLKQHEIFNLGIHELKDCDCVFIADADEFFAQEDFPKIVSECEKWDGVATRLVDYIDYNHSLPIRTHHPIIACNPKKLSFNHVRCAGGNIRVTDDITMHHFGYAWKGELLDWKHKNKWYQSFHELMAQGYVDADCPQEIRNLIESNCRIAKI